MPRFQSSVRTFDITVTLPPGAPAGAVALDAGRLSANVCVSANPRRSAAWTASTLTTPTDET
jgi:hypothetical protein